MDHEEQTASKRVLVCGGRNYQDWRHVADTLPTSGFDADFASHGPAAERLRNERMIVEGKPDLVIAFSGGEGTADLVSRARAAGVPVEQA